jgi:hypothetical protein
MTHLLSVSNRTLKDGCIRAQSLNPGIDDQILYHHEHDFAILGRVIDNKQQLYTSLVNRFLRRGNQQLAALEYVEWCLYETHLPFELADITMW